MRIFIPCLTFFIFFICLVGCASSEGHENTVAASDDSINVEAIYIGLIDSHSIEVIIDQTPTAIQISDEQFKKIESWPTNTPISITYYVQKGTSQNILEQIEITK